MEIKKINLYHLFFCLFLLFFCSIFSTTIFSSQPKNEYFDAASENVLTSNWLGVIASKTNISGVTEINFIQSDIQVVQANKVNGSIGYSYDAISKILDVFSSTIISSPRTMNNFITASYTNVTHLNFEFFKLHSQLTTIGTIFEKNNANNNLSLEVSFGEWFDTESVTSMSKMFSGAKRLTRIDWGSKFSTEPVEDMSYMFEDCVKLREIDLSSFDTQNVTDMSYMFKGCTVLTSIDLSGFNLTSLTETTGMFEDCSNLANVDFTGVNTNSIEDMSNMFKSCIRLSSLDLSNFNTATLTNVSGMFQNCANLESINLTGWNTVNVENFSGMFEDCERLASIDLSNFNTASALDMNSMFANDENLLALDLSNFNTANVQDMSYMFGRCTKLQDLNISSFDTRNVTNMQSMFFGCKFETFDISFFDTANCESMAGMFCRCYNLVSLNMRGVNTSKVSNFSYMFSECFNLNNIIGVEDFDTAKATNFDYMFHNSFSIEYLTLNRWNVKLVRSITSMFDMQANDDYEGESQLKYINLENWELEKLVSVQNAFNNCVNLQTIVLPDFTNYKTIQLPGEFYSVDFSDLDNETEEKYDELLESSYNIVVLQKSGTKYLNSVPTAGVVIDDNIFIYILNFVLCSFVLLGLAFVCTKTKRRYR